MGNKYAIEVNSNSSPTVESCIIWDNDNTFYVNGGGQINLSFSLIPDYDRSLNVIDNGKNMLGVLPDFIDLVNKNYGLKKSSPALKSGKGGKNMGAL